MKREIVFQLQPEGVNMIYRTDTFSGSIPLTGIVETFDQPKLLASMFQSIVRDPSLHKLVTMIQKVAKTLEQEKL